MILYLTYWFPRRERAKITALFMVAIPVSSVLGSPISGAIIQYGDGFLGLDGWRVMFLLEGIPAVVLAFVTWFYLTDRPAKATWLADDERAWLARGPWVFAAVLARDEESGVTCLRPYPPAGVAVTIPVNCLLGDELADLHRPALEVPVDGAS